MFFVCLILFTKGYLNSGIERIDLKIQYFKDEIEIKIESIKNELDKLNEKFQSELDLIKEELIRLVGSQAY